MLLDNKDLFTKLERVTNTLIESHLDNRIAKTKLF